MTVGDRNGHGPRDRAVFAAALAAEVAWMVFLAWMAFRGG